MSEDVLVLAVVQPEAPVHREVDGRTLGDILVAVLADLGPQDDLELAEAGPLLALGGRVRALALLRREDDDEGLDDERAGEALCPCGRVQPVEGRRLGDGLVGVRGRRRDWVVWVVRREEERLGALDGGPGERVERGLAAVEADALRAGEVEPRAGREEGLARGEAVGDSADDRVEEGAVRDRVVVDVDVAEAGEDVGAVVDDEGRDVVAVGEDRGLEVGGFEGDLIRLGRHGGLQSGPVEVSRVVSRRGPGHGEGRSRALRHGDSEEDGEREGDARRGKGGGGGGDGSRGREWIRSSCASVQSDKPSG